MRELLLVVGSDYPGPEVGCGRVRTGQDRFRRAPQKGADFHLLVISKNSKKLETCFL